MDNMDGLMVLAQEWGMKLLYAVVVLIIGLWVIGWINKLVKKVLVKQDFDASLVSFLTSLIGIVLKLVLAITILDMLGIQMTSFIAILGAAGLAIGMALSGTLQNFAGGVMILIFKPFKTGDLIEAQGYLGVVDEIQIFVTLLSTPDNKRVIIPNAGLSTGSMINYSAKPHRRVDLTMGISYSDDIDKAKELLYGILKEDPRVLDEPAPYVGVVELGDNSVNFAVRPWVKGDDYWGVYFDTHEKVKKVFDQNGVSIPFPQRDVHIIKED